MKLMMNENIDATEIFCDLAISNAQSFKGIHSNKNDRSESAKVFCDLSISNIQSFKELHIAKFEKLMKEMTEH